MRYSMGQDLTFVILALISALALLSQHFITSFAFFIIAILFILFEDKIYNYYQKA